MGVKKLKPDATIVFSFQIAGDLEKGCIIVVLG
jgi:hypothetical protein